MMHFDDDQLKSQRLREVNIDPSAILKIMKHCSDHTIVGSGQLLGMERDGILEITHSFAIVTKSADEELSNETDDSDYQVEMMRNLRQLNYDSSAVGWYQSTFLGSHWNQSLIESQFEYQKALEHAVVVLYDPTMTSSGSVALRAMRLTDKFMKLFAEKKITMELLAKYNFKQNDIFEILPVKVKNSNLSTALLYQLSELSNSSLKDIQTSLSTPSWSFNSSIPHEISLINPTFDVLEQRPTNILEKHLELLIENIENYGQEQWRWHGWQRNLSKEQQKLNATANKRKTENESRSLQGLDSLYSEEDLQTNSVQLKRILANEPSRLESLVLQKQLSTYCEQVQDLSEARLAKMIAMKALTESNLRV